MSILYVVATPIGNLGDMSQRAMDVLRKVPVVACEDTRRTAILMQHCGGTGSLIRLDEHAFEANCRYVLQQLEAGKDVAFVSDAGSPSVADPGYRLVEMAHEAGVRVVPLPGASAVTTILSVCGFNCARFWFGGFLPRKEGVREQWADTTPDDTVIVVFLSVHRLETELAFLAGLWPQRRACLGRELTKQFEEIGVRTLAEWQAEPPMAKGEFVVALEPLPPKSTEVHWQHLANVLFDKGIRGRKLVEILAQAEAVPKNTAYEFAQHLEAEIEH